MKYTFFRLHWEMEGHWSRVNLVKREVLLKDLQATSILSFPNANEKKGYFNPYTYAKAMKQEAQRATYRAPEYNVSPFLGIGKHFCLLIGNRNTNLVEDIEILLPVKFHCIPFSDFRGEVANISTNQRPWRPSCFSDWPKKHKLGRGRWDLASCQVIVEFPSAVSEEKSKMSQPIRGHGGHLIFPISPKNTNLVEDVEILLPVKFSLNSLQWFQRRSRKCLNQSEAMAAILFFRSARKTQTW